jgi:hypothetical protein
MQGCLPILDVQDVRLLYCSISIGLCDICASAKAVLARSSVLKRQQKVVFFDFPQKHTIRLLYVSQMNWLPPGRGERHMPRCNYTRKWQISV